jgi:hypothetical protein
LAELLADHSPRVHSLAAQLIEMMLVEAQTPQIDETSGVSVPVTQGSYRSRRRQRLQ